MQLLPCSWLSLWLTLAVQFAIRLVLNAVEYWCDVKILLNKFEIEDKCDWVKLFRQALLLQFLSNVHGCEQQNKWWSLKLLQSWESARGGALRKIQPRSVYIYQVFIIWQIGLHACPLCGKVCVESKLLSGHEQLWLYWWGVYSFSSQALIRSRMLRENGKFLPKSVSSLSKSYSS